MAVVVVSFCQTLWEIMVRPFLLQHCLGIIEKKAKFGFQVCESTNMAVVAISNLLCSNLDWKITQEQLDTVSSIFNSALLATLTSLCSNLASKQKDFQVCVLTNMAEAFILNVRSSRLVWPITREWFDQFSSNLKGILTLVRERLG